MASTNDSFKLKLKTKIKDCSYPMESCQIKLEEQHQHDPFDELCGTNLNPQRASAGVLSRLKERLMSVESSSSAIDHGDTAFVCIHCGKVFNDTMELSLHQSFHHTSTSTETPPSGESSEGNTLDGDNSRKKTFICVECGEFFDDSLMLQCHRNTIHKSLEMRNAGRSVGKVKKEVKKPFECSECGQHFEKRSYLLLHMRLHTGERPYKCSVCSKEFRLIGHITSHMSTHIKERPYECSVCHKKFARGDYMKKHMKTHTGEKPHICSVCEKAFTLKGNLERHMISHTKEKRYSCSFCDEKFSWEKTLQNHIRKTHGKVVVKTELT